MLKVILPNSWDYGEAVTTQVKMATRGLFGADYQALVKRAGEEAAYFLKHCPDLDQRHQLPLHVIAMGATESIGPNRNGDGFKEAALRKYSPTFEKFAKVYRNHKNKPTDPHYGIVKKAYYNERMRRTELLLLLNKTKEAAAKYGGRVADEELETLEQGEDLPVSMSCGVAGTPVKVLAGFKPIEQVQIGEQVLSHKGRYRTVLATASRLKTEYLRLHVRCRGRLAPELTPDHEVFVARWRDLPKSPRWFNGKVSKDPTGYSKVTRAKYRSELHNYARFIRADQLQPTDLLLMPIPKSSGESKLTVKTARLLGYYTADGSKTETGICLTVNKQGKCAQEITNLVNPERVRFYDHSASEHAYNIRVRGKRLRAMCFRAVGDGARNKHIPDSVYNAGPAVQLNYLAAWFNGDGWQDKNGLHWSTVSPGLATELQMLLAGLGIAASVARIDHPERKLKTDKRIKATTEYVVSISNPHSPLFEPISKAEVWECKPQSSPGVFITGGYLAFPLTEIERVEGDCDVYDLQVEEDESFTAYGLAVHNCKIAYDICSVCDNKAKDRSEYCESMDQGGSCPGFGCKYGLTKVSADGHVQHVDNPHPIFFDISSVYRPADRIAFGNVADYLLKAAASAGHVGGAKLAEAWGVSASEEVPDLLGVVPPHIQALLTKLARVEQNSAAWRPLAPFFSYQEVPFSRNIFGAPGTKLAESSLQELTRRQICLSADQFLSWLGADNEKIAAVKELLPGIFLRLSKDPELASAVPVYSKQAAEMRTLLRFETVLGLGNLAAQAFTRGNLQKNAAASVFSKQASAPKEPKPIVSHLSFTKSAAGQLAGVYVGYVLDFLSQQPQSADLPLTMQLVVAQNHR